MDVVGQEIAVNFAWNTLGHVDREEGISSKSHPSDFSWKGPAY
jgi:hypothetical protein